jgi:predicted Zn-dependent peptidase
LLFKGTKRRSAREISQAVEGIGGYLNAFTSEENSCFYARVQHAHFNEVLEVLLDMYLDSVFDPAEIDKEREVIKEELSSYMDDPAQYVHELLNAIVWPGQPLGRSITGTRKTLDKLGRPEIVAHVARNYVASSTVIAAAGRLKHGDLVRAVMPFAGRFSSGPRPTFAPAVSVQTRPGVILKTRRTEQTQMALGIRTCSRHDERRFALRVLNALLGENMSSRLFQTVREDQGLAYSIYSSTSFFGDVGDLVISAGMDLVNLEKTLGLVVRELRRLTCELVSPAELRRACDYIVGQIDLNLENSENQMMWVGEHLLGYGRIHSPETSKRRIQAVKAAEVRAVARDFIRPDRFNLALISPMRKVEGWAEILERAWNQG